MNVIFAIVFRMLVLLLLSEFDYQNGTYSELLDSSLFHLAKDFCPLFCEF
jgi:hypothetical protein